MKGNALLMVLCLRCKCEKNLEVCVYCLIKARALHWV